MEYLVTYDVATDSTEGRRRLRQVAHICEGYGQRVQKSVFECSVSPAQWEKLRRRLERTIKPSEDSLRFYRLREPLEEHREVIGRRPAFDLGQPLVV